MCSKTLTSGESSSSTEDRRSCFRQWMDLQQSDLSDLIQAKALQSSNEIDSSLLNTRFSDLINKSVQHFEEYIKDRSRLALRHASPYFAPSWCSTLENSLMWIGGCRPSIFIRLTYALCGLELEAHLYEIFQGEETRTMGDLTGQQISKINSLHRKTVQEEDRLATRLASIQEDATDHPIAAAAIKGPDQVADMSGVILKAVEAHEKRLVKVLESADGLRMQTLKELLHIFSPKQGVDFLAAGKKLHLSFHEWGKTKDREHGRHSTP